MRLPLLFLAMLISSHAQAGTFYLDGNDLWKECETKNDFCNAYIIGVSDAHDSGYEGTAKYCSPQSVPARQIRDIVLKYLEDTPAQRHRPAPEIIVKALTAAFPC